MDPLEVAALRWAIGGQPAEELPDLATDALVRGLDTPSLRQLAGLPPDDYWQIVELFAATVEELGIQPAQEQEALWKLARHAAEQVVNGEIAPVAGASWIWWNVSHRIEREGDFRIFIGLASEWQDHSEDWQQLDRQIVDAAEELLGREQPRRWVRLEARRGQSPVTDSKTQDPIRPELLPISDSLAVALLRWSSAYDATFGDADGRRDGYGSPQEAEEFVAKGKALSAELQEELGDSWHVEYYPEPTRPPGVRLRPH